MFSQRSDYAAHLQDLLAVVHREADDFLELVQAEWDEHLRQLRARVQVACDLLTTDTPHAAARAIFREVEAGLHHTLNQLGAESVRPCPQTIYVNVVVDPEPSDN